MEVSSLMGEATTPPSSPRTLGPASRIIGCLLTSGTQLWPHPWNTVVATRADETFCHSSTGGIRARRARSHVYHSPRTEVPGKARFSSKALHEENRGSSPSAGDTGQM